MLRNVQQISVTAFHELRDGLRSRWAIVLLVLYVVGSIAASYFFSKFLAHLERQISGLMGLDESVTGTVTASLWESPMYRRMLKEMLDSRELAEALAPIPPMALFFGSLSLIMMPIFVMLMASPRVAAEMESGSARFVLFRTSRLTWCFGKFWGQAMMLLPVLLISAIAAWGFGLIRLRGFDPWVSAHYTLIFGIKAFVYSLAWLGLATCASQLTRSSIIATIIGILILVAFGILDGVTRWQMGDGVSQIWDAIRQMLPQAYWKDLWWPGWDRMFYGGFMLLLLSHLYILTGYFFTSWRDN